MKVSGSSRKLRGSLANLSRMAQASGGGFTFFLVLFLFLNCSPFFRRWLLLFVLRLFNQ